jgi:amidase
LSRSPKSPRAPETKKQGKAPHEPDELAKLDATGQAELVRGGRISALELVDAAIARIERTHPQLNAVIHPAFARARARAAAPDLPDGPFRGVPFLMKDIGGEEAGEPVYAGLAFAKAAAWKAPADAWITEKFRAAGLVSLGRTNTPELALLPVTEPAAYGATRNPWSLEHSPGGSSGGASAAVAAGLVPAAHASDGGGSIRGPASMCGLVGLKPTRGRSSFGPGLGERWSGFSAELVVTRSVRDSAALLDVTAGPMPGDPYFAPPPSRHYEQTFREDPGRLRIGLMQVGPRGSEVSRDSVLAVNATARVLEGMGHHVEEAHPSPLDDPQVVAAYVGVVACNVARALDAWGEKVGRAVLASDVEPLTWALAEAGRARSGPTHLAALEFVHAFGRRLAAWWDGGFDLLLTPTQAQPPPRIGALRSTPGEPLRAFFLAAPYGVYTLPFNLSGQPAISVPSHWTSEGLPVGSQLVAAFGREDLLLQVAARLEEAVGWLDRRPPLFG